MSEVSMESASFRDRNARVFYSGGKVYRGLGSQALSEWEALSGTSFFTQFSGEGSLVQTERVNAEELCSNPALASEWSALLRHETVQFISYPYEWAFGMLKDAALLQLDLLSAALDEGMILKDSSAFNVQWRGAHPVFIDIASFEKLRPGEPWIGYRQFCQMFLFPLMLQSYKDVSFHALLRGCIDGIEPETFNKLLGARDLLRPGVLLHVFLQAKVQTGYAETKKDVKKDLKAAGFSAELIKANVKGLKKLVSRLTWQRSKSEWSNYAKEHSYTDVDFETKKRFVGAAVDSRHSRLTWDLGCNTGTFSRIAAKNSDCVVAMDADQLAIEFLYQELKKEGNGTIIPLVGNIADPSPNLGWRGMERKALSERGKPDLTLCLALIHHVVITANIPLREFIHWLSVVTNSLVIEFVTKDDPMVKKLLRNKVDNYADYELPFFEESMSEFFNIDKREELVSGSRILFFATSKIQ